jgi:hypothetical protein
MAKDSVSITSRIWVRWLLVALFTYGAGYNLDSGRLWLGVILAASSVLTAREIMRIRT